MFHCLVFKVFAKNGSFGYKLFLYLNPSATTVLYCRKKYLNYAAETPLSKFRKFASLQVFAVNSFTRNLQLLAHTSRTSFSRKSVLYLVFLQ